MIVIVGYICLIDGQYLLDDRVQQQQQIQTNWQKMKEELQRHERYINPGPITFTGPHLSTDRPYVLSNSEFGSNYLAQLSRFKEHVEALSSLCKAGCSMDVLAAGTIASCAAEEMVALVQRTAK